VSERPCRGAHGLRALRRFTASSAPRAGAPRVLAAARGGFPLVERVLLETWALGSAPLQLGGSGLKEWEAMESAEGG
jgi:hypothetical protein